MRLAIVGGGVSGLLSSYWLRNTHEVTLFEAEGRLGGHTNTVSADLGDGPHRVDTGFVVYNEANYPLFSQVLRELGVATQPSEMSFSVSSAKEDFEYRGNGLRLWSQPANALRPSYTRLLIDIASFNRAARKMLIEGYDPGTLADFVGSGPWGRRLWEHYVLPLGSAIWSANPLTFGSIPAKAFAQFLDNHGWLRLKHRPKWRTVRGGATSYVKVDFRTFSHGCPNAACRLRSHSEGLY